jgi:site-specific DNA-cytosine methylase
MRAKLRKQLSTFLKRITSTNAAEGGVSEASRASEAFDFRKDLQQWRDAYPVSQAQEDCARVKDSYSCGIFSSGGCLDTLAAIRCGFTPKWGTEICETKQRLWSSMTKTVSLGDTFKNDFTDPSKHVVYLKSGQTCIDYSSSHEGRNPPGSEGETGWMFVSQVDKIMEMMPRAVCIEMVANAMNVNEGKEVEIVIAALSERYHVHADVCRVADYGDCSNRTRLMIVCFHRDIGDIGAEFEFPKPFYDEKHYYTAHDIAVEDSEVPEEYWIHDKPYMLDEEAPKPLQIHKIAQTADGMGHSSKPNAVQTFYGLFPTQTTHNGGGRRVSKGWKPGDPIGSTRLTVPVETCRIASLPHDYQDFVAQHDNTDTFLRTCVNMGVPLRTSTAIDEAVHSMLQRANVPFDTGQDNLPTKEAMYVDIKDRAKGYLRQNWVGISNWIRAIYLDRS